MTLITKFLPIMRFEIKHNSSNYKIIAIKLWVGKLFGRITKQRKNLTLIIVSLLILAYLLNKLLSGSILSFILIVLIIDLIVTITNAKKKTREVEKYIVAGGEEFWVYAGKYFCYVQDDIEFKKAEWEGLYEYCRIKEPISISFRNRDTKEVHIFYENEFATDEFIKFREIVNSKIKVIPLM